MSILDQLASHAGTWHGTNKLQDPRTNAPDDSPSTALVTPVLGGKFVRFDYTWSYQDKPQEGSLLFGCDPETNSVSAHWIDSWHMGAKVMACHGPESADGSISVRGSYAAPPGPDWGWRINLRLEDGQSLKMIMFNITPDGREELAVEASWKQS